MIVRLDNTVNASEFYHHFLVVAVALGSSPCIDRLTHYHVNLYAFFLLPGKIE
jgi:hypothetical protein